MINWKTSHKPKKRMKDIHDFPEQVLAYTGAINSDKNYTFNVIVDVLFVSIFYLSEHCLWELTLGTHLYVWEAAKS